MKTITPYNLRRALGFVSTGLALSVLLAASARADMYRWPATIPVENTNTGAIRGVTAASIIGAPVITDTNVTLSWYGMQGWYAIEGSTDGITWSQLGNSVAATTHASSATVTNPLGVSGMFRLRQANAYTGSGDCSGCHGDTYNKYATTAHATAINEILNPDGSFKPFRNASCLPCHTVGMGQSTGYTNQILTPQLANVGCESCHGPAAWHKYSDHDLIRPAVSIDPSICGNCHQDSHHPTYEEYEESLHAQVNLDIKYGNAAASRYYTNTAIIGTNVYYGYYVTTNANNTLKTNATTGIVNSGYVPGSAVDPGQARAAQCGVCHSAATRYAMLSEYNDAQAGRPHPINFAAPADGAAWSATCATCHDPHATNNISQLRYPTRSTDFYTMPTTTDTYVGTQKSTNALGVVQTETIYKNTTFDSMYNPNIQVCAQCHNSRGARWDGQAYTLVTNAQAVVGIGITTPLIPYTNSSSVLEYSTNSSGYGRPPHHSPQYNILVGQADTNFYVTSSIHAHGGTGNANQCVTCHAPSYAVNANTNVTGHTFELGFQNCVQCHPGYSDAGLEAKIEDLQYQESNSVARVVSLLNQWATTPGLAPDILRTNYGNRAWEFTTPGILGNPSGNTALVGPPSAYSSRFGAAPAGTNDNLQLMIPEPIRKARFNIYMVQHDGSMGVHNPTYTKALLNNAETLVAGVFTASNYVANFSVMPLTATTLFTTYVNTNVTFTNLNTPAPGTWNFGGPGTVVIPQTSSNVTYAYSAPGLYTVSYTDTASGSSMTRTAYIQVREYPVLDFTADVTAGLVPLKVTVTNTSINTSSVDWWRVQFSASPGVNDSNTRVETTDALTPVSFTYTNIGIYSVLMRANLAGGGNVALTKTNYITVNGLKFAAVGATTNLAPMAVTFTNQSIGMSNYVWNFGDGQTSTSANPVNVYTNAGTYTVTLTGVFNGVTTSLARTSYIVANPAPVAGFYGINAVGQAPLNVAFVNTSANATNFVWSFGDGKTSTLANPPNTYTNVGAYTVTLQAINLGVTNTLTRTNYIHANP